MAEGGGEEGGALADQPPIPPCPVLLAERHQLAVRVGARRPACVRQQHQREQPGDLGVVRQHAVQRPGQPDRLPGQLDALQRGARGGGVALIEDQVQDVEDGAQ